MSKKTDKPFKPIADVTHLLFKLHKLLAKCIKKKSTPNSKTFICELDNRTRAILVETLYELCEKIHIVFTTHDTKLSYRFYDEILDNSITVQIIKMLNIVYSSEHAKKQDSDLCNKMQNLLTLLSIQHSEESSPENDYLNEF